MGLSVDVLDNESKVVNVPPTKIVPTQPNKPSSVLMMRIVAIFLPRARPIKHTQKRAYAPT